MHIGKEEVKQSEFSDNYDNLRKSEGIYKIGTRTSKFQDLRSIYKNQMHFHTLAMNNWKLKFKKVSIILVQKYDLGINLAKTYNTYKLKTIKLYFYGQYFLETT